MSAIFKNIKMIGIGKGGSHLVSRLHNYVFTGLAALAISTNKAEIDEINLKDKILILKDPKETKKQVMQIRKSIFGYSCILIFVQFGGDNSAHLASALANISSDMNIASVAICSISHKLDKYSSISIKKLKEHCKNILWIPKNMTISEMFTQNEVLNSLAFLSDMEKQTNLPPKEESIVEHKSFIDRIIGKKPKKEEQINSDELFTQDEFGFNTLAEQRGFFQQTPRNMHNGVDLDIPSYLRKNLKIHL